MKNTKFLIVLSALFLISPVYAAMSPLGVSIVSPLQFPASDYDITGARVSLIFGRNRDFTGIDLGLLGNITTGKFTGLAISGLFNNTRSMTTITGLQLAGLANINSQKTTVYGIQAALGANYNNAESTIYGFQLALANLSENTTINGLQVGIYNKARAVRGFQIGLINMTQSLSGIQIGLLNFYNEGLFKVSPIINIGF